MSRFPRREDVDRSNTARISHLNSKEEVFPAIDGGAIQDKMQRDKILANFMAPQRLSLRLDAQVMLIKNVDETLVNGTMGRVIKFVDPATYRSEQESESSVGGGGIIGTLPASSAGKKSAAAFDAKLYPLVEFSQHRGHTRRMLVLPDVWKVELPSGEIQVSRTQVR